MKVGKDMVLDEQTTLLLELSVRKQIVNDTRGKVDKIVNNKIEVQPSTGEIPEWL